MRRRVARRRNERPVHSRPQINFSGTETLVLTSPAQGSRLHPARPDLLGHGVSAFSAPVAYCADIHAVPPASAEFLVRRSETPFSTSFAAKYGTAPYTWSVTGLPPGLAHPRRPPGTVSGAATAGGHLQRPHGSP